MKEKLAIEKLRKKRLSSGNSQSFRYKAQIDPKTVQTQLVKRREVRRWETRDFGNDL